MCEGKIGVTVCAVNSVRQDGNVCVSVNAEIIFFYMKENAVWNDLRNHRKQRNLPQSLMVGACEGLQLYETRQTEE